VVFPRIPAAAGPGTAAESHCDSSSCCCCNGCCSIWQAYACDPHASPPTSPTAAAGLQNSVTGHLIRPPPTLHGLPIQSQWTAAADVNCIRAATEPSMGCCYQLTACVVEATSYGLEQLPQTYLSVLVTSHAPLLLLLLLLWSELKHCWVNVHCCCCRLG
jgi:hypothetical protein